MNQWTRYCRIIIVSICCYTKLYYSYAKCKMGFDIGCASWVNQVEGSFRGFWSIITGSCCCCSWIYHYFAWFSLLPLSPPNTHNLVFRLYSLLFVGMPYPQNLETAKEVERIVRENGAVPATIAILDGTPCVGLYCHLSQLHAFNSYFTFYHSTCKHNWSGMSRMLESLHLTTCGFPFSCCLVNQVWF